jgi:hypothetical protein
MTKPANFYSLTRKQANHWGIKAFLNHVKPFFHPIALLGNEIDAQKIFFQPALIPGFSPRRSIASLTETMIPVVERREGNNKCGKRQFAATPASGPGWMAGGRIERSADCQSAPRCRTRQHRPHRGKSKQGTGSSSDAPL